ncbi:MAG: hypothetical protein NTZ09_20410 [Candidatus Hydrogenedentes bacterium]|nr:hypothetical protein [Candidatus Hydrogenedentota bacterium]
MNMQQTIPRTRRSHMKYPLIALIAAVNAFSGIVAAAQIPPTPAPAPIKIQVDPHTTIGPVAKDFIGFGYETSAVAQEGFFSEKNKVMVQLYRTLCPGGLVRIGGIISDWTKFEANGTALLGTKENRTLINQRGLDDLGGFLRATGWKVMWGLNLGTGSKEEAVEQVLAVHKALGDRLQSFQIGNDWRSLPPRNSRTWATSRFITIAAPQKIPSQPLGSC